MAVIPDPLYNRITHFLIDSCLFGILILLLLCRLNLISIDISTKIFSSILLFILGICIYDKIEQYRYSNWLKNKR